MTSTPSFTRSFQSLMPFGLPLRTRNTIVDVYGQLLCGKRFCQSAGIRLGQLGDLVDVVGEASVTTSAFRPSMTARACVPAPPCDCSIVTSCPCSSFQ